MHLLEVISPFLVPEKRCLIETVQMFKCFSSTEAYRVPSVTLAIKVKK